MYAPRTPNYSKRDMKMRWALPDRVFFACGACHILAYSFLTLFPNADAQALWFKPAEGYTGNHIVAAGPDWVFDYHGFSRRETFIAHIFRRAQHYYPGWDAKLIHLPNDVLVSEAKSKTVPGLWLMEPGQFLHDAMPRAQAFRDRLLLQARRRGTLPAGIA